MLWSLFTTPLFYFPPTFWYIHTMILRTFHNTNWNQGKTILLVVLQFLCIAWFKFLESRDVLWIEMFRFTYGKKKKLKKIVFLAGTSSWSASNSGEEGSEFFTLEQDENFLLQPEKNLSVLVSSIQVAGCRTSRRILCFGLWLKNDGLMEGKNEERD